MTVLCNYSFGFTEPSNWINRHVQFVCPLYQSRAMTSCFLLLVTVFLCLLFVSTTVMIVSVFN